MNEELRRDIDRFAADAVSGTRLKARAEKRRGCTNSVPPSSPLAAAGRNSPEGEGYKVTLLYKKPRSRGSVVFAMFGFKKLKRKA